MKEKAQMNFVLAKQVSVFISKLFDEKNEVALPEIWDYYPTLFAEEQKEAEQKEQANQLAWYKARMIDYSFRHNQKKQKGGGDK